MGKKRIVGDDEARFWSKVRKTNSGCWLWTGPFFKQGYGQMKIAGVNRKAHRLMWERDHGTIPDGMGVLHVCDNPPCVRPDHLFLGTPKDNADDRQRKGRNNFQRRPETVSRGERHYHAKLTEEQVRDIKARYAREGTPYHRGGLTLAVLAEEYGIHKMQVSRIVRGEQWSHVTL